MKTPHEYGFQDKPGRWRNLAAFAFATVVDGSESSLVNGLFPTLRTVMGLSLWHLSLLTNVNKLVSAVLGPFWAMIADRYNRKRILVFVTGLWGFWTIAIGFTQSFESLLALYFIASLGSVASAPIIMSAIADLYPDRLRGRAMGVFGALSVILAALLTPLFSLFARVDSWQYGYYLIGGLSVLGGVLISAVYKDPGRGASEDTHSSQPYLTRAISWRDFLRLAKISTLVFLFLQKFLNAGLLVVAFGTVYMVDVFGYQNDQAILIVFLPLLFGNILGNILGGVIGDIANRRYPLTGRIAVLQTAFFCSAVMSFLATQIFWSITAIFYVVYFVWGVFLSFGTGLDRPMIAAITPPELRSAAYGFWMSSGDALSSLVLVTLVGWLGDRYGLRPVFLWLLTGVMTLRVLIWFYPYRTYPQDVAHMRELL